MGFFSKIRGTFETLFQIGKGGPQVKNNAGVVEMRDPADAAFVITRGLAPVAANDYVTKGHFDANNDAATGVTVVRMPLAIATKVSTGTVPDNAEIVDAWIQVTTAYDAGALFDIKRTGDAGVAPMGTGDSDLATVGTYHVPQDRVNWGSTGLGTVTATLTNIPTVGVAELFIAYVTPTDIS